MARDRSGKFQAKGAPDPLTTKGTTADSFVNFAAKLGIGAGNLSDASGYEFNFISRQRTGLEAAYRGSWVVGAAVDYPADDMTTAGIVLDTTLKPDEVDLLTAALRDLRIWQKLASTLKWSRLYGGAVAVMLIDGQNMATPLDLDTIKEGQFKGLYVLDRWTLNPAVREVVQTLGPDLGMPEYYTVLGGAQLGLPNWRIHYSRVLRFEGLELPFQQRLAENLWGMSVIERLFDRLVAFDSTTTGAAQLVFRAYLRTYKIPKLRELIAAGGAMLEAVTKQIDFLRLMQSNEGLSVIDAEDEFEALEYSFSGLDSVLLQFGQQLSGAMEMPMVRLFGQSPTGLNSTGESDLEIYDDGIKKKQERDLRQPVTRLLDVLSRSLFGKALPEGFTFTFAPLRQISEEDKATIGAAKTSAIVNTYSEGVIERSVALKELKATSDVTGMWSNISDVDISEAEDDPPIGEHLDNELNPPEPELPAGGKVTAMPKKGAA